MMEVWVPGRSRGRQRHDYHRGRSTNMPLHTIYRRQAAAMFTVEGHLVQVTTKGLLARTCTTDKHLAHTTQGTPTASCELHNIHPSICVWSVLPPTYTVVGNIQLVHGLHVPVTSRHLRHEFRLAFHTHKVQVQMLEPGSLRAPQKVRARFASPRLCHEISGHWGHKVVEVDPHTGSLRQQGSRSACGGIETQLQGHATRRTRIKKQSAPRRMQLTARTSDN